MIVVTGDYGQLGNRLVVFANLIAAARAHGLRVANPAFYPYAGLFPSTRRDAWCRYPARLSPLAGSAAYRRVLHGALAAARPYVRKLRNRTRWLPPGMRTLEIGWERRCDLDSAEFLELARASRLLLIRGWRFRAPRSLPQQAEAVRAYFRPAPEHAARSAAAVHAARQRGAPVVGVHIRQGDYAQFLGGRLMYPTAAYVELMRRLQRVFAPQQPAFVVCSNTAQPPDAFGRLPVVFGPGQLVEDMYALADCDYIVGPPSTFSTWASFYGRRPWQPLIDPAATPTPGDFHVVTEFSRSSEDYG